MIRNRIILLVEDNLDEVELTLRAFEINEIANEIVVVNDGQEALDHLFTEGCRSSKVSRQKKEAITPAARYGHSDRHQPLEVCEIA